MPSSPSPSRLQLIVSSLTLAGSFVLLLYVLHGHLKLADWLFPRYLGYFLLSALIVAAWFSTGWAVLTWMFRETAIGLEAILFSVALGCFVFLFGWTLIGFLDGYNIYTFVAWPVCCLALGAPSLFKRRNRFRTFFRRIKQRRRPFSTLEIGIVMFGACATLLAYAPILTPQNVAFDGRWYHLPMAERYALMGGIHRYSEGWFPGGYPQFASILYSWAFLLPSSRLFDHIELSVHLEFVVFLLTLASIPLLARRLLPRDVPTSSVRHAWVALFLFPELFIYDSSINGGADHIVPFWAVPVALATMRAYPKLALRRVGLLAVFVSAVLLSKYTAASLLVGPGLLLAGRVVYLFVDGLRKKRSLLVPAQATLVMFGTITVLWAPHWLKNLIWYRDPLFPLLHGSLQPSPWTPETPARWASYTNADGWHAARNLEGVLDTLQQLYLFSFVPNDWATFHRDWPMFGFLFTLLVPIMLVARSKRLAVVMLWAHAGVLFWYWTFHQDRYLQTLLPWMSACVATCLVWLWRTGAIMRALTSALVALQIVWGLDAPFFGTHLVGQPLRISIDFLSGGFAGKGEERLSAYPQYEKVAEALPPGAVLLRHEMQMHLGFGVPTVSDWFQTGISWGTKKTMTDMHRTLRHHGVTHVVWASGNSKAFDSYAADINFFTYATQALEDPKSFGNFVVGRVPDAPPPREELQVLYVGCMGGYAHGLYPLTALNVMPHPGKKRRNKDFPRPASPVQSMAQAIALLDQADVLVHNAKCLNLKRYLRHAQLLFVRQQDEVYLLKKTTDAEGEGR